MLYHINNLCPRTDILISRFGFCIDLFPQWRELVADHPLTQIQVNTAIRSMGRSWLDACGFDSIFDPDNFGFDKNPKKKPGPNARPTYEPHSISIQWGEWGPEHITVPGNACGLDMDRSVGTPRGGQSLLPHNVDTMAQAFLLLVVFTWFAEHLILNESIREYKSRIEREGACPT